MNKLDLVFLLTIIVVVPTAVVAWQTQQPQPEEWNEEHTESEAIETALDFLKNSPTYMFDGLSESINVSEVSCIRPPAPEWLVTIEFECRHAGYGDRTGKALAQVITPHTIVIIVKEGKVVKAVVDDKWDELNQREIVPSEIQPSEFGRDKAIDYILKSHEELKDLQTPSSWERRNLTADPPIPGLGAVQYIGDGWTVNVTYPVVPDPIYTVEIKYTGEVSFHWKGTVDQDGNVDEIDFAMGEEEALTTVTGEYLSVGNPCTTTPCLPSIVYAVLADGTYYYLTVEDNWIWENRPWDGYIPTEGDHVKVTGYVSKRLDVNGNCFYEIQVVSLIQCAEECSSEFKVVVNGVRELSLHVPVNVTDGLTREEAEQIAEATFVQVMGEKVMHRLDALTVDENSIEAHHTWGLDESDMGHVFDMTVDIALRLITVTHCL